MNIHIVREADNWLHAFRVQDISLVALHAFCVQDISLVAHEGVHRIHRIKVPLWGRLLSLRTFSGESRATTSSTKHANKSPLCNATHKEVTLLLGVSVIRLDLVLI
jgi:hypothetical protein